MKFLHCSDIHLGRRPIGGVGEYSNTRFDDYFNSFSNVVDYAITNHIELFLIAGDFFDKRDLSPDILERAEKLLAKLSTNGIKTVLIEGNHDNISSGAEKDSWIVYLDRKLLISRPYYEFINNEYQFVPGEFSGYKIYGLGYSGSMTEEAIEALSNYLNEDEKDKSIVLVHTAIAGDNSLAGTVGADSIRLLQSKAFYVGGGHVHSQRKFPSDNPYFFVPGSTEYFDIGEVGQTKGFFVYDTETKNFEFVHSSKRDAIKIQINSKARNSEEFESEFLSQANSIEINEGKLVYCEVNLSSSFFVDTQFCESHFTSRGALRSSVRINHPQSVSQDIISSSTSVEDAEKIFISDWQEFANDIEHTWSYLNKFKHFQAEGLEADFVELWDELLENLIKVEGEQVNEN